MSEQLQPAQSQEHQPGSEAEMEPRPQSAMEHWQGTGKLAGKVALVTGGDSGIGRAVAVGFAKEGADVVIAYLDEHEDAQETMKLIQATGQRTMAVSGDIGDSAFCDDLVDQAVKAMGRLDILVNNAAEQHVQPEFESITDQQIERTFRTNIFSQFFVTRAALPHLKEGAAIINSTSVTAYKGSAVQIDYAATKGAIVSFTRSLSVLLMDRGIRVNAVAPGPIWTPLIPSSYPGEKVATHGEAVPMHRAGQPDEVAPSYIFLASADASYMSGQVLHPNGGTVING